MKESGREYIIETTKDGSYLFPVKRELIRCKKCKYSIGDKMFGGLWCQHPTEKHCERNADFYCGSGERREDVEIH